MARPQKQTIDYFPHLVSQGKTIFILENEFGNDGYAFWFKLLELLCTSDGQKYDYNSPSSWRFLLAKTHVTEDIANAILKTLVDVNAIDNELNQNKIIWVQKLVDNLELVYNRRTDGKPPKPSSNHQKPPPSDVSADNNLVSTHIKPQTIQYNTIQYKTIIFAHFETFWKAYPKKRSKGKAEKVFTKLKPDDQLLKTILAAIEVGKKSIDWQKDGGKFIPYPATWLAAKGWDDEFVDHEESKNGAYKGNSDRITRKYSKPDELLQ